MRHFLSGRSGNLALQLGVVILIAALLVSLILTARDRFAAAGLVSGFGFLTRATGWELGFSVLPVSAKDPYWRAFLAGLLNTLTLATVALALASVLGIVLGGMRNSRNAVLNVLAACWVNIFRNVPMILQLLLWYKLLSVLPGPRQAESVAGMWFTNRGIYLPGLNIPGESVLILAALLIVGIWASLRLLRSEIGPRLLACGGLWVAVALASIAVLTVSHDPEQQLVNMPYAKGLNIMGGIRLSPEFLACLIALTVYGAAYIAEIVRAGFNAVDNGLLEASRALGVSELQTFLAVRLPLALRAALPMLINQYVWLMKATTVGIAVGFADLFMVTSSSINQSGQTFEILAIFMASFLVVNYALSSVLNVVNRRVALKGNGLRATEGRSPSIALLPNSWHEAKRIYFGSIPQLIFSLVICAIGIFLAAKLIGWSLVSAVWAPDNAAACRVEGAGACWSIIAERWRLIFFGLFPWDEQWRSGLALVLLIALLGLSALPAMWQAKRLALLWLVAGLGFWLLMRGGWAGLSPVALRDWGGLTLTVFIFAAVVSIGMPLGLLLALVRRSKLVVLSKVAGAFIDITRSLPLLALMYGAAMALPFALPDWLQGDKLWRVIGAFALFYAAYQAEIFRAGFQSMPAGQEEAAKALGLGYRYRVFGILLPQVFRKTLPVTVNQLVITFKETSLVTIIGFFDILASGAAAFGNPEWSFAYLEVYVFVGGIYFLFVTLISRYGLFLERRMAKG